jgi:hypothetical protein
VAGGSGTTNTIYYSYDLIKWTGLGKTVFDNSCNHVVCNGNIWVAVGSGGNTIATSPDGITWTGRGASILTSTGNGVEWNGSLWVAVGSGGNTIATSPDGTTWTGRGTAVFTSAGHGVAWNGRTFVATGDGTNSIATSSNGINWNPIPSNNSIIPLSLTPEVSVLNNGFLLTNRLSDGTYRMEINSGPYFNNKNNVNITINSASVRI